MHISIHAPRVGRDAIFARPEAQTWQFQSTRPVWGATYHTLPAMPSQTFQSTRPVWGATCQMNSHLNVLRYFNPRAPCGARRFGGFLGCNQNQISIHAPRVGRDACAAKLNLQRWYFNPRAPCGARRFRFEQRLLNFDFNPRAPCGARPAAWMVLIPHGQNFNPRAPCGARHPRCHVV